MGLYWGSEIKGVYCGSTEVKEAYAGAVKVYGKSAGNVVHIGENDYPFVQIGDLLWITDNLKESVGTYESYDDGYLYRPIVGDNTFAQRFVEVKKIFPYGWRIPEKSDWLNLYEKVNRNFKNLVSKSMGGDDIVGFNLEGSRYRTSNNNLLIDKCIWWSNTHRNPSPAGLYDVYAGIDNGELLLIDDFLEDWTGGNGNAKAYIRVCKDA